MLVSKVKRLVTIVELISVRNLEATHIDAFSEEGHHFFYCGDAFCFGGPLFSCRLMGDDVADGLAAMNQREALACLHLRGEFVGMGFEFLNGDGAHERFL